MTQKAKQSKQKVLEGFAHELDFWETFVKTDRFLEHWDSDEPNPELRHPAGSIILAEGGGRPRVLDVGSGVVSLLMGTVPRENLTAVDPLADKYKRIYKGTTALKGHVEDLSPFCKSGLYDVVHISNALDHSQNPMAGLLSMLAACKPGGLVYIQGFVNERDWHNGAGLHQWNIDVNVKHGRLIIAADDFRNVFEPKELVYVERAPSTPDKKVTKQWFHFVFRKSIADG